MVDFASRLRVLPMLIGSASLLLAVKVGGVWTEIQDHSGPALAMATANAAEPRQDTAAPPATQAGDASPEPGQQAPAAAAGPKTEDRPPHQTAPLSQAELDVLQQLTERRTVLDQREG